MSLLIIFILFDTVESGRHNNFPWSFDQQEEGRAVRFVSVALSAEAVGTLKHLHAYEGRDLNKDNRPDANPEFTLGNRIIGLRGVRDVGGDSPAHKLWGLTNPPDVAPWMESTSPRGAIRYRVFSIAVEGPPFNILSSLQLSDAIAALGNADDGVAETTHLCGIATAGL